MDIQRLIEEEYKEHEPFYCKEHALAISKRNVYERIVCERSGEPEVVPTIWDNKRANNPPEVSGVSGGIAISALGALSSPGVIFGLGLLVGVGYVLYKLSSDDAQTSSNGTSVAPSVSERLDRIEEKQEGFDAKFADIEKQQNEAKAILAELREHNKRQDDILARLEQPLVA